jgi:hypothetical protein
MGKEATEQKLIVADLRGGRNGTDPPLSLPETQCVDALNVDWDRASVAHKRNGASQLAVSFLSGIISFLGRFVPNNDDTKAQLMMADDAATPVIVTISGGTAQVVTSSDAVTGKGWDLQGASIKGKYMMAFQSAVPRFHCYEATTGVIRRTGLAAPVTLPPIGNGGTGSFPAILRYYRLRVVHYQGSVVDRRSEPGPATGFQPSGINQYVLITLPTTLVGEGETFWELEVSLDGATYYLLATIGVGATTYTDTTLPTTYGTLPISAATGTYALQRSYRFVAVDQNRVLGFGSFTATDPQNRLEFSGVAGSTNVMDEERVPLNNYIDLDEADSGPPTGLIGPVFGAFYAFKYRQVWKLTPTGNALQPYSIFPISKVVGSIHQNCIKVGEDAGGNPTIYFMSARGPYRLGLQGLEYLGLPNEDLWLGPTATVNLESTTVVAHAVYHTDKHQVWFWYASGASNDPNIKLVYDVRRAAWARHDGASALARCSAMYSNTIGTNNSRDLKPYIGITSAAAQLYKCDNPTISSDAGTLFQAYVLTKPYLLGGMGAYCTVGQGTLIGTATSFGLTITLTLIRDFGKESRTSSAVLITTGSETRVQQLFDAAGMAGAWAIQLKIGDAAPVANNWRLDIVSVNYIRDQSLV